MIVHVLGRMTAGGNERLCLELIRRAPTGMDQALITIDPEAFPGWKQRNGKDASASVGDLAEDSDLIAEVELAVKDANQAVSHAESIRKFRILPVDFTEDTGELTPTLKVKRKVVAEKFASDIDALYTKSGG